ncbi:hypothetical protein OHB00_49645 [Streptomyces sp. NBC_00631]|uniref:hypothetical protein n=1 Tax=Streptomyces sp. NBC_00631 TaxID=2975793 RepID=UPI0030E094F1
MAVSDVFGMPDPNVELAARAGDAAARRLLGEHHDARGSYELAKQWLLAAAEAGDPEAMHDLAQHYKLNSELLYSELMKAGQAGPPVMEYWLGRAAEAGHVRAMMDLADLLMEKGQATEAEHWYRAAIDNGRTFARIYLVSLLIKQDRLAEAEPYARLEAQAGSWEAARQLAEILEELGRTEEAAVWRSQAETLARSTPFVQGAPEHAVVVVTAVVTTAVVPFLQAVTAKIAEDAYGQVRQLVRRLLRRNGRSSDRNEAASPSAPAEGAEPGLAILQDPDAGITLFLWSNASDEALRALSSLDLAELTLHRPGQGQVHLVWHPASGTWHIRGS